MSNTYISMKRRHEKEVNEFPMFAAFSESAFQEGMKKLGLGIGDRKKVASLGCGVFIRTADVPAWSALIHRHEQERKDAIRADQEGTGFIREMFSYELANHEYCYTMDLTETLNALGLTVEEINASSAMKRGLDLAICAQKEL